MNWRVFTTVFVSLALLMLPQNSFTCGPSEDPYDYYTSFFSNRAAGKEYKPFYYTGLLSFYDNEDWSEKDDSVLFLNKRVTEEWKAYGKGSTLKDVVDLVYSSNAAELSQLAESIKLLKPSPPLLAKNTLAQALVREKKIGAVSYLAFAKKTEAIATVADWTVTKKDSLQLSSFITEASDLLMKATEVFLKNKYAFLRCKLAFYASRYADCVRWYDEYFTANNSSAVNELALSYKGGSLFRMHKNREAAYAFSKAFPLSAQNKKSHFLGFLWATDNCNPKLVKEYTALCKNNLEKANMIGMFAMYGTGYKLNELQNVYELNPASPLLPLLATREIHKLEEQYLTPLLEKEKGGKALYTSFADMREDASQLKNSGQTQVLNTAAFFEKLSNDKTISDQSFYSVGAAYLHFMAKDYEAAKTLLAKTNEAQPGAKLKEQTQLINLLIAANETKTVTKETEAQLLPSIKWLVQKAKEDEEYRLFCRNFFSQMLAQKYAQQNDAARVALAYSMADMAFLNHKENAEDFYSLSSAIDFVQAEMNTAGLLKLYETMTSPSTETEKFFVQNASVKRDAVIDVIGTSHLRDRNYAKAIEWLSKAGKLTPMLETEYNYQTGKERKVNVDPFYDYLNDWQRYNKSLRTPYTKLTLARKLLELQNKLTHVDTVADKAKLYYTYASALYNMSYYGNSWSAVAYNRSGVDWNEGAYKTAWEKEFFGVYEARNFYQKAYDVATTKEYKAACLFMVIKCAQRQIPRPAYDYRNEAAAEKAEQDFKQRFKYNPLFVKFKSEFEGTKFYPYVYNRCSYLRDYVKKGGTPVQTSPLPGKKGIDREHHRHSFSK